MVKRIMAAATLVSVRDYLNTSYRSDREMTEGELVKRKLGEYDHNHRISAARFRVPDVCVISCKSNLPI